MTNKKSQDTIECNFVMEQAEEHFISWIYWDTANPLQPMSPLFLNGTINKNSAVFFARPYPLATAGIPIKVKDQCHRGLKFQGGMCRVETN